MRFAYVVIASSVLLQVGCSTVDSQPSMEMNVASATPQQPVLEPRWNMDGCTARREVNHSLIFAEQALDALSKGDVLYVFAPDGVCAGASRPFDGKNFAIAAWGDDRMTARKDGLTAGESFVFVLSSPRFNRLVELHPTKVQGPATYAADGITIIRGFKAE